MPESDVDKLMSWFEKLVAQMDIKHTQRCDDLKESIASAGLMLQGINREGCMSGKIDRQRLDTIERQLDLRAIKGPHSAAIKGRWGTITGILPTQLWLIVLIIVGGVLAWKAIPSGGFGTSTTTSVMEVRPNE